ncbi:MAG: thioesterase family protein [Desulfobacter sp.]|nr:MAG: thioesterase family protein [Desulfobacter sp.]
MPDTDFATLMDKVHTRGTREELRVPEEWMQGRTAYGGLVAAMALKSMRVHLPRERKVRSLLFSFVGPVDAAPFFFHTQVLRSGKSVTTIEAKLVQKDQVRCTAVGSFGGDRESKIRMAPVGRPEMPAPSKAIELPYIEGMTPAFTRHFNYRWAMGELPFSGRGGREIGGWINFCEETDCLTEEWLIALADAWPSPVLSKLREPAAASTLTWALEFVHLDRSTCSENQWWAYHCTVDSAEKGYANERSIIWDPEGRPAVFSQQTTAVFG